MQYFTNLFIVEHFLFYSFKIIPGTNVTRAHFMKPLSMFTLVLKSYVQDVY